MNDGMTAEQWIAMAEPFLRSLGHTDIVVGEYGMSRASIRVDGREIACISPQWDRTDEQGRDYWGGKKTLVFVNPHDFRRADGRIVRRRSYTYEVRAIGQAEQRVRIIVEGNQAARTCTPARTDGVNKPAV